jgi:hypothetical protein
MLSLIGRIFLQLNDQNSSIGTMIAVGDLVNSEAGA